MTSMVKRETHSSTDCPFSILTWMARNVLLDCIFVDAQRLSFYLMGLDGTSEKKNIARWPIFCLTREILLCLKQMIQI